MLAFNLFLAAQDQRCSAVAGIGAEQEHVLTLMANAPLGTPPEIDGAAQDLVCMAGQDTGGVHLTHGVLGGVNGHIVVIQQGTAAAKVHGIQIIFALGGAQRSAGAAGRKDTAQLNAHLLDPGVPALLYGSCIPAAGIIAQQLNLHQPDLGVLARTDAGEGSGGTVFGIAPQHLHDGQAAARFYDATEGTVEILGRPAADYPREALRGKVNVVMQKAQLFGGTIRSNLLWGNKNATDAELWAALETAQAAEFVQAKPLGLDEPVEQGGRNLSGGQKQRLTIARALVGKPDILILDDSASALDYATDAALRKALAALPGSLTVFIVSQRAASLQHADQILVLDDGRLVGLGTHDQLRQSCPVYEEIYESQFKKGDVQK